MDIYTGFLIGFLGSFHCVGMCGPIALALPVNSESQLTVLWSRILYNLGRVITYAFFGAMFGLFGQRLSLIGLQETASIALGAVILLVVLSPRKIKNWFISTPVYQTVNNFVKDSFAKLANSKSSKSFLWFGIVNGFLPCGFVYVAIAGAVSTGGVLNGTIFMALFGLGTFPIMLGTSMAGKYITQGIRRRINKLMPVFAVILGIIFILRGLGLGIPYLSPKLKSPVVQSEVICH
jgi:sulfite exporter TauE/SafE